MEELKLQMANSNLERMGFLTKDGLYQGWAEIVKDALRRLLGQMKFN